MTNNKKAADNVDPHPMEDLLQVRVARIDEVIDQIARHSVFSRGLRKTDMRILNNLYDAEALSINELARRAHVDKAWISRSVVQLLDRKWISKQQDPRDSRVQLVRLTPKSRRLLDEVRPQVLTHERMLLEGIDEVELKRVLDHLLDNALRVLELRNAGSGRSASRRGPGKGKAAAARAGTKAKPKPGRTTR